VRRERSMNTSGEAEGQSNRGRVVTGKDLGAGLDQPEARLPGFPWLLPPKPRIEIWISLLLSGDMHRAIRRGVRKSVVALLHVNNVRMTLTLEIRAVRTVL
jgi:hypothetical protein